MLQMVDMVASNLKLKKRSHNMLRRVSAKCKPLSDGELDSLLVKCNHSVKLAVLVAESQYPVDVCERHLEVASGVLAKALADINRLKEKTITETSQLRPFVLCVDGGGTKCAAVVTDGTGAVYRGFAGPCNLYENAAWPRRLP